MLDGLVAGGAPLLELHIRRHHEKESSRVWSPPRSEIHLFITCFSLGGAWWVVGRFYYALFDAMLFMASGAATSP